MQPAGYSPARGSWTLSYFPDALELAHHLYRGASFCEMVGRLSGWGWRRLGFCGRDWVSVIPCLAMMHDPMSWFGRESAESMMQCRWEVACAIAAADAAALPCSPAVLPNLVYFATSRYLTGFYKDYCVARSGYLIRRVGCMHRA